MEDRHPVSWLMETLKPQRYQPLSEWMADVLGAPLPDPSTLTIPDWAGLKCNVGASCRMVPTYVWIPALALSLLCVVMHNYMFQTRDSMIS